MKLYNLKGEVLKSVQTKSGDRPKDIPETRNGGLVYPDRGDRSVNLSTASGDLLVIMESDDEEQTKVVRYSGSTETQTIQWDDHGKPLYSSGEFLNTRYLSENSNSDICVADSGACAVVVM
uniref:Uncharacterized protein LOC111103640 n=1 Tax=Crassostrea virginica TaxID=6565 RepID=A0A8B8ARE0_CRAVI|nr:uncharacterized protein LOC111103640 [Crassostrea virginica]